jgi:Bacterial pre-peptidase C-terminal domain
MKRQLFSLMTAVAIVVGVASAGNAASPSSGTVGPSSTSVNWNGQTFAAAATPSPSACPASADSSNTLCDHFKLTVSVDASYWKTHTGGVSVSISWQGSSNNFDLYVYDSGGSQVAASAQGSGTSEHVTVSKPSGAYEVRVVPQSVVNSGYNGSAVFSSSSTGSGSTSASGSGSGSGGGSGGSGGKTKSGSGSGSKSGSGGGGSGGSGGSGGTSGGGGTPTCPGCSINGNSVSEETMYFTYGTDRKDWYWSKQVDQGIQGTGARLSLPNPQANDTLPVSVDQGAPDKVSAIYFGLLDRGLQPGSSIVEFKLRVQEGDTPSSNVTSNQDQPEYNVQGHQVEACRATEFWPDGGGAELWSGLPKFAKTACVAGKSSGKPGAMFWTFDLTQMAQPWGRNPNSNFGVVLYPVIPKSPGPQDQEWQINLKIPARDNPSTPNNEYNDTKKRVVATIAFSSPGTGIPTTTPTTSTGGGAPSSSGGGGTFTGGGGFGGGAPGSSTTTTTTTTTGGSPGTTTGTSTPVAAIPPPHVPGIIWLLVPIGLLGIWAIRQVVLEPIGETRPGGAIAAIRRRNAAARGMPVEESGDMLTQAKEATRRARSLIRKSLRRR